MNNAREILMQILDIMGANEGAERAADDFCTWIEVQVMTDLIAALPQVHPDSGDRPVYDPAGASKSKRLFSLLYCGTSAKDASPRDQTGHCTPDCCAEKPTADPLPARAYSGSP